MLRAIDEIDGPGVATTNLVDKLLELDRDNEYVIFYKNKSYLNRYKDYSNVKEIFINTKSKLIYDQFWVPILSHKEKVDLIFNTKFTVPLLTKIKSITIMRGSEYWIHPDYYEKLDRLYVNLFFPLYCMKAIKVITLSNVLKYDLKKFLKVPLDKMVTIYSAPNKHFEPITDFEYLERIRKKFTLPSEKFVLSVTKPYSAAGSKSKKMYDGKNMDGIIKSFLNCQKKINEPIKLVFLGKKVKEALHREYGEEFIENKDFIFPGYIPQEYMPAIYNLAELLLFPSYYESFGIPLVEAMACGCPVVTSNTGACPEIVGEAGLVCNPDDFDKLSESMVGILTRREKFEKLKNNGLERVRSFSWDKSARNLMELFRSFDKR
jgi:glycosyltransferase involved in cell wall biosynthesis